MSATSAGNLTGSAEPAAPELEIARDIAKRAVLLSPAFLVVCTAIWGLAGLASSAFALGLVVANFLLAAALMAWGARTSVAALGAAVLGGYILRLALITAIVLLVKDAAWVDLVSLGFTLIVAHLVLLTWETRYVSASLAYPGLQPGPVNVAATDDDSSRERES